MASNDTTLASASSATLRKIEEDYFQCSICLEGMEDPKLLPCLHRFCAECLKAVIQKTKKFKCPLCKTEHVKPAKGVDGFKTDFAMKNILEDIQKSVETLELEKKQISAGGDNTPKPPNCQEHKDNPSNYCCVSCGNIAVCNHCGTVGTHSRHNCQKIEDLCRAEVDKLIEAIAKLLQYKDKVQHISLQETREKEDIYTSSFVVIEKESIKLRYDYIWTRAKCVLESNNDWSKIQLTPEILSESEKLIRDISSSAHEIHSRDVSAGRIYVTQQTGCIDILATRFKSDWEINGIASCRKGVVVATGKASQDTSHISVFDIKGIIIQQRTIKRKKTFRFIPKRYCASLTALKVATVCIPDEVGVYNVPDGSYKRRNIGENCSQWDGNKYVMCVATDPDKGHIFVGSNSNRALFVFDERLNFIHVVSLPDLIKWPRDLSVQGDLIFVCDFSGKRAFAVQTLQQPRVVYEFRKPSFGLANLAPFRICVDENMFIYIIWEVVSTDEGQLVVAQYVQQGGELINQMLVNKDARSITTLKTTKGEKLLLAARTENKVFVHDLVRG